MINAVLLAGLFSVGQITKEPDAPLSPREAPLRMTVPAGFKVTLFAGEPDVRQPIAFTFDDRGRLWVVECYSYPKWHQDPKQGKDRVLIFEDTDGDGVFDKRTVFAENLSNLSGIEYGFGGIWLCSLPNLLFIPIKDGEDRPAGPPEIKLDGWSMKSGHNVFSNIKWGPDGWLYGCNGIIATSLVGPPGTAEKDRVPLNCGVWRYHPTRKKFEAYAWGTTNPWGLDWDEHGEMFITNCVIAHLWHVVPGGHYERMYGQDLNPNVYGLMKTCADHLHWAGGSWTTSRGGKGAHSDAGGGHAHVGCMIYLGDNWPERYRNGVFMCNLHGSRINHDILERNGSSYVARHGKDFLFANDPWFRGIAIDYGPDGGVYVTDWTDTGECHNYKVVDASNGRIFKVTHGKPRHFNGNLAKLSDKELADLHMHKNDWFVRHARRLLQERAATRKIAPEALKTLEKHLQPPEFVNERLRALWALYSMQQLNQDRLCDLLKVGNGSEYVRAWAVRLLVDGSEISKQAALAIAELAGREASPLVRLYIASALQCAKNEAERSQFITGFELLARTEDANDANLPLMYWYAIERAIPGNAVNTSDLLTSCRIPLVREYIARRCTLLTEHTKEMHESYELLFETMTEIDDPTFHRDLLRGIQDGLSNRRQAPTPRNWKKAYPILMESPLEEVRERALALAVQMGDERAVATMRKILVDDRSTVRLRLSALASLLLKRPADLAPTLQQLLKDGNLRGAALRGLAGFEDPNTPKAILEHYKDFSADDKADAVQTLSSRVPYALALLMAVEKKQVPAEDLSNFTVRQLQALGNKDVTDKLSKFWGAVRPTAAEKLTLLSKYKNTLTTGYLKGADKSKGRALFQKSCAACHRLFDSGGAIGPDITGAQRHNLDYILENILDPSAVVANEYQVAVVTTTSGRTLTGLVKQETARAITLQTQNELVVLPRGEVESLKRTKQSMMPDGLLDNLRIEEVRDLIAYLASPVQVSLTKGP